MLWNCASGYGESGCWLDGSESIVRKHVELILRDSWFEKWSFINEICRETCNNFPSCQASNRPNKQNSTLKHRLPPTISINHTLTLHHHHSNSCSQPSIPISSMCRSISNASHFVRVFMTYLKSVIYARWLFGEGTRLLRQPPPTLSLIRINVTLRMLWGKWWWI